MRNAKNATEQQCSIEPKKITSEKFDKYGWVIGWNSYPENSNEPNQFRIVVREDNSAGWRIAYLIVREKIVSRLEQHIDSKESFEPVKGKSILYVSTIEKPAQVEAFYLDQPIVLKKGIWHGIVSIDDEAHVKITENSEVSMDFYDLGYELKHK